MTPHFFTQRLVSFYVANNNLNGLKDSQVERERKGSDLFRVSN